jgi:cell division protein FtsQ
MSAAPKRNRRERAEAADEASGARPIGPRNRRTVPRPSSGDDVPRPVAAPAPRRRMREALARARERLAAIGERLRKPALLVLRVLVVIGAIVGSIALFRVIERHVRTSPSFATEEIEISGAERLERVEIEETAGLAVGRNVFAISPDDARRNLLAHPWIADAEVRRRLPGRWTIAIQERTAAAVLMLDEAWLVAADGAVFKRLEPGDPADLPVITGIDRDRFTADRAFRTRVLLAAVALLSDWRAAGLWRREPIGEIHVEADDGLTLRIGDDSTEVRLGAGPYRAKLDRLRRVLDELGRREGRAAYVHLDNPHHPSRVIVRAR